MRELEAPRMESRQPWLLGGLLFPVSFDGGKELLVFQIIEIDSRGGRQGGRELSKTAPALKGSENSESIQ